jgi:hypothetical protein
MKKGIGVPEVIERRILLMRGHKIMISIHLAALYGVETRALNQAVKRNANRFPPDFVFQLTAAEADRLVSQNVIPHRKYLGGSFPYAFTEQGVAMLSTVLKSERAILMNIAIMRAFVKLREILSSNKELELQLKRLEVKMEKHDEDIQAIFEAIYQLMSPQDPPKRRIGFDVEEPKSSYRVSRKAIMNYEL